MQDDRPWLVFDVNETLLDLESLAPLFERMFGDRAVMREWFAQLVLYSQAITLAGDYAPFGELGGAVLKMIATIRGHKATDNDVLDLKHAVASMPPHPEVAAALGRLKEAGFRLATLTNNPSATCEQQLERAGLVSFFERRFSVDDTVRRYKPAPETYGYVERELQSHPSRLCMVACHAWDTLGAVGAGWTAALILRPGNAPLSLIGEAGLVGSDLGVIADALIADRENRNPAS